MSDNTKIEWADATVNYVNGCIVVSPGCTNCYAMRLAGPGARPMDELWARSLRDQCRQDGVAFFMKQMSGTRKPLPPIPDDLQVREFPQ